jgi:hypothetical protein
LRETSQHQRGTASAISATDGQTHADYCPVAAVSALFGARLDHAQGGRH